MKILRNLLLIALVLVSLFSCENEPVKNPEDQGTTNAPVSHNFVLDNYVVEDGKLYSVSVCDKEDCNEIEKTFVSDNAIVATPENINQVINSVNTGAILLTAGEYGDIFFDQNPTVTSIRIVNNNENPITYEEITLEEAKEVGLYRYLDYHRDIKNLSIYGAKDSSIKGTLRIASIGGGTPGVDPVLGELHSGAHTYRTVNVDGLVLYNLNFSDGGKIYIPVQIQGNGVNNLTIENCTFNGTDNLYESNEGQAIRIITEHLATYNNIIIKDVSINNYYQGIYIQDVNNITIESSTFSKTKHNAIGIQQSKDAFSGNVVIKNNKISNVDNRAVRFGAGKDANIKVIDNEFIDAINSGNELLRSEILTDCTYSFTGNTYNGNALDDIENASETPWVITIIE